MIQAFALFLGLQLAGELVSRGLGLPVPGPVVGLLVLLVLLVLKPALRERLAPAADALHAHLSMLFVPAGVGVMLYYPSLLREWVPIVVAVALSTLVGIATTAWVLGRLIGRNGEP
jgi:holin-like protein